MFYKYPYALFPKYHPGIGNGVLYYCISCCVEEKLWPSWTEGRGGNTRMDIGRAVGSREKIRGKVAVHSRAVEVV